MSTSSLQSQSKHSGRNEQWKTAQCVPSFELSYINTFFYLHHTKDLRSQRWWVDSLWAVSIWTGDRDIYNAWPCLIIAQRQTTSFLKLCSLLFPNRKARRETGRRWNSDKEFHKEDTVSIILELHHYHFVFLCWCS